MSSQEKPFGIAYRRTDWAKKFPGVQNDWWTLRVGEEEIKETLELFVDDPLIEVMYLYAGSPPLEAVFEEERSHISGVQKG